MTGALPYYPGYEPLWVGDDIARAQVDESELVHPIADGAEAYYTYESGDSISWTLPDKRTIRLRELRFRPRQPKWNLSVGSLWFDASSGELVRAAYRLSVPIDIWQVAAEEDSASMKDMPGWAKQMVSPVKAEVTAIAIEYGLHEGRFWLPRLRLAEGRADISFMHLPFKMEQSFTYASVNLKDSVPPIQVAEQQGRAEPPDSLSDDQAAAWRDSVRKATRDSVRKAAREEAHASTRAADNLKTHHGDAPQCDTSKVSVSTRSRYNGALAVQITVPCDYTALAHSPDLPASIYDPGEELFGARELDELKAQALSMRAQAPFSLRMNMLPPPAFAYGPSLMRYNRVEGFSAGASVEQQLGGGYSATALGRLGVADLEPNVELTLMRTNLTKSMYLTGYNHLVSASDWGNPLSFGSSFSALMFGRDEGFYYKATGAELGGAREPSFGGGSRITWRAFVEQERTAAAKTDFNFANAELPAEPHRAARHV